MVDARPTQVRRAAEPAGHAEIVRRTSLGMTMALLVQLALGIAVNLYVTVPARDQGGGTLTAIGRALSGGPVALALHAGLGLLILLGTITLLVRSILSRRGEPARPGRRRALGRSLSGCPHPDHVRAR